MTQEEINFLIKKELKKIKTDESKARRIIIHRVFFSVELVVKMFW